MENHLRTFSRATKDNRGHQTLAVQIADPDGGAKVNDRKMYDKKMKNNRLIFLSHIFLSTAFFDFAIRVPSLPP